MKFGEKKCRADNSKREWTLVSISKGPVLASGVKMTKKYVEIKPLG